MPTDLPWNDPSCDFKKVDLKLTPNALTEQYVKRDFEGQFLEQNNWKDQITICPGQSPGSDTSTVIASYKINGLTVTYQVVGHAGLLQKKLKKLLLLV